MAREASAQTSPLGQSSRANIAEESPYDEAKGSTAESAAAAKRRSKRRRLDYDAQLRELEERRRLLEAARDVEEGKQQQYKQLQSTREQQEREERKAREKDAAAEENRQAQEAREAEVKAAADAAARAAAAKAKEAAEKELYIRTPPTGTVRALCDVGRFRMLFVDAVLVVEGKAWLRPKVGASSVTRPNIEEQYLHPSG